MPKKQVWPPDCGQKNEERFHALVKKHAHALYPWIISITKADPALDKNGIDALVTVYSCPDKKNGGPHVVMIPIQIKSSENGKRLYYSHYCTESDNYRLFVAVIVVNDTRNDQNILAQLASELGRRRALVPRATEGFLEKILQADATRQNYEKSHLSRN